MNAEQFTNWFEANAKFEQECWQQAKAEVLASHPNSGIDFAVRVAQRAQAIKLERQHAQKILAFKVSQ